MRSGSTAVHARFQPRNRERSPSLWALVGARSFRSIIAKEVCDGCEADQRPPNQRSARPSA
jgi:hypothetical protein